jgi:hypothetical protein
MIWYVPAGVDPDVVRLRLPVTGCEFVTDNALGTNVPVTPDGKGDVLRLTLPVKPPPGATVTAKLVD